MRIRSAPDIALCHTSHSAVHPECQSISDTCDPQQRQHSVDRNHREPNMAEKRHSGDKSAKRSLERKVSFSCVDKWDSKFYRKASIIVGDRKLRKSASGVSCNRFSDDASGGDGCNGDGATVTIDITNMSAATVLRRQSSTSGENDVRMRNSRGGMAQGQGQGQVPDSPPSSPSQPADRGARACCFCCLAVKSGTNQQDRSKDAKMNTLQEKPDEPPTFEELKCWGESFEKLMKCAGGRKLFREFLRSEYSEENMLFWLACEELKSENNPELVEEKARLIYEDYISILSPKEVSLDSRVREVINQNMVQPTPHTFDEAQLQIFTLMHRDSYPRFLNSQMYKRLLQQYQST